MIAATEAYQHLLEQNLSQLQPMLLTDNGETIKLQIKPYLQPFEEELAIMELRALLGEEMLVDQGFGYWTTRTNTSESLLRERLTYWQRLGRDLLVPTLQTLLEFTQNGRPDVSASGAKLHRARRLRYGPHGLHEYRGKFFPQLVRSLMTVAEVDRAAVVLDPMCGSGTTPSEAISFSNPALGADLNPLSVLISRVKCSIASSPASNNLIEKGVAALRRFKYDDVELELIWPPEELEYIQRWFDPEAIADLSRIISEVRTVADRDSRDFLLVCLSDIIRSVSWQKVEDLRVRKDVRPYRPGDAIRYFEVVVNQQANRILPYLDVLGGRGVGVPHKIREGNAVRVHEVFPEYVGRTDLIITSPPYATALPYLDTDRLSIVILGLLSRRDHRKRESSMVGTREVTESMRAAEWSRFCARESELPFQVRELIHYIAQHFHADDVGFRRRNLPALLGKYFLDMLDAMGSARRMMRANGSAFYIVGNNSTNIGGERFEIPTDSFLEQIGKCAGWDNVETIEMELLASRDVFRGNRGSKEVILWLRA